MSTNDLHLTSKEFERIVKRRRDLAELSLVIATILELRFGNGSFEDRQVQLAIKEIQDVIESKF